MQPNSHAYRADIDGLRAVAVLPVVFYHAGLSWFSGGYVGVDVFFVISGYLITGIISREILSGEFRLRDFYARRARRLFPALFAMIFAACIAAWWLLMPGELEDFGESVATTALFTSNFLFFTEAGYFDGPAELKPLLHTWSLAIEEQYYLLFPAVLILARRYLHARLLSVTVVLLAASFALSLWSVARAPDAAFYLLPSRTWELMLGSLLALLPMFNLSRGVRELMTFGGLGLILAAVFAYTSATPFPGAAALAPCVGTALVIAAGHQNGGAATLGARLLSLRAVVFVGLISYSLYLWHWPVIAFAKHALLRHPDLIESCVLVTVSVFLAVLSWRYIEGPFRHTRARRGWFADHRLLQVSGATMLVTIVVGQIYDQTEGLPGRLPPEVARIAAVAQDKPAERKRCEGIDPEQISVDRLCRVGQGDAAPSFIVWGDSHAMSAMPAFHTAADALGITGLDATSKGCVPFLEVSRPMGNLRAECVSFNAAVFDLIKSNPQFRTVVWVARWARHSEGTGYGNVSDQRVYLARGDTVASNLDENRALYEQALSNTLAQLETLERHLVVLGPIPEIGDEVPIVMAKALWQGRPVNLDLPRAAFAERQAFVHAAFERAARQYEFAWHPAADAFCNASWCAAAEAGIPLYFDDNHIASRGAARLDPLLRAALRPAIPVPGQKGTGDLP